MSQGLEALLDAMLAGKEEIGDRHVARSRAEMPNFAGVPIEEHRRDSVGAVVLLVGMRRADLDTLPSEARALLLDLGERRAAQGVPLEDMLRSWRMGIEEAMGYGTEIAPQIGLDEGEVFGFFQQAFEIVDEAMVEIARGHRTDPAPGDPEEGRRASLVRDLLEGNLSPEEVDSGCVGFGLDPLAAFTTFRARAPEGLESADADERLGLAPATGPRLGMAAILGAELAGFSIDTPPRAGLDLIAVGPPAAATELAVSYRVAGRVLAAAETFGLVGVQDLATAGLHTAVIERSELGGALVRDLIDPVRGKPSGEEILHSVDAWLSAGMRVEPAAERLFVHPNTVRYRLRRYQEMTGTDLSITEEAFRVWWALRRDQARR
jgi:hypothetical protein